MPKNKGTARKKSTDEVNWTINGLNKQMRNRFVGMCKTHGVHVVDAVNALLSKPAVLNLLFTEWVKGR